MASFSWRLPRIGSRLKHQACSRSYPRPLHLTGRLKCHDHPPIHPVICLALSMLTTSVKVNMPNSGTWIFTTDQYHVKENYHNSAPQGWLARDHDDWVRSHQMIKTLQKRTNAKVVFGHCKEVSWRQLRGGNALEGERLTAAQTLSQFKTAPDFYD